jgi:hypothetical protein
MAVLRNRHPLHIPPAGADPLFKKKVLPQILRPIPRKLRIRHAILIHSEYGSIILSSRRAIRDNRYPQPVRLRIWCTSIVDWGIVTFFKRKLLFFKNNPSFKKTRRIQVLGYSNFELTIRRDSLGLIKNRGRILSSSSIKSCLWQ